MTYQLEDSDPIFLEQELITNTLNKSFKECQNIDINFFETKKDDNCIKYSIDFYKELTEIDKKNKYCRYLTSKNIKNLYKLNDQYLLQINMINNKYTHLHLKYNFILLLIIINIFYQFLFSE